MFDDPKNPVEVVATRPIPGVPAPIGHDNVFAEISSRSVDGLFEPSTVYIGEPDAEDVQAPRYFVAARVENHGGDSNPERDWSMQCVLRCDGGGTTPIALTRLRISAASTPRIARRSFTSARRGVADSVVARKIPAR